ncbi:MAG: Gfo/Idh/MocA family oxidoreductase [Ardenticatenaceae bacterium]|nr:Gfo/Idh/MocA family oxidoreductase [Ardenticatenaceae bacterium]HBY96071.1 gfo/Idh/MocA family oxidoreductase [Chloroflexota bacterium]
MTETIPIRVGVIGCGGMARQHVRRMLRETTTTRLVALCDLSPSACAATAAIFREAGLEPPPCFSDLDQFLVEFAPRLDAVLIATPHAYHHDQAVACLEAGLDVLLEKPMVVSTAEAWSLIEVQRRTRRLLVVAFNGGLSPYIRTAVKWLRAGELGSVISISATVWEGWGNAYAGHWKQRPEVSGGGFMFDTGVHMMNTVATLADEDFVEIAAWLDTRGHPHGADLLGTVMGRLASGAMVTLHASGDTIRSCDSEVLMFCTNAILRTGVWGERLEIQRAGENRFERVEVPAARTVWQQFLAIRNGEMANPCPPEVGLRVVRLWEAIKTSAANNGVPVKCEPLLLARE